MPTSPKMDFKPTPKDEKILGYICKNYSCKICNSILIQCVTLSCGHQYCNYCLDMLTGGKSQTSSCPQCSTPIKYAQPNDEVDQKIDNLIHSCSKPIHKGYTVTLNNRFQKSLERSRMKNEARLQHHQTSLQKTEGEEPSSRISNSSFDDMFKALVASADGCSSVVMDQSLAEVLKSASGRQGKGKMITPRTIRKTTSRRHLTSTPEEIDVDKVNSLFGIYDHFLQHDNEPKKELAGGDFSREENINDQLEPLEGMRNFTRKSDLELKALIKEADDVVLLDEHIQQWTKKMKDVLVGNGEADLNSTIYSEDDKDEVDDELWKSSNQLVKRLQQFHSRRQEVINSFSLHLPTLPPVPRSTKLDLDGVSDDSDVEEYEEALSGLQESLKNQPGAKSDEEVVRPSSARPSSARSKSSLDLVEESGHVYIKENIQFITQIRKYKDALMKIQNREVETAPEIKELLSFMESSGCESPSSPASRIIRPKPRTSSSPTPKSARPRVTHYSPLKAPPSPHTQQKHTQPFSARHPSSLPSRPRTACTYDQSRSPSPGPHQLLPKLYMTRGRRGNVTGPLYTAR